MGFLNKVMAAVGIGATRIDTRLNHSSVQVGDTVGGVIVVQGGKVEQQIEKIGLSLMTKYRVKDDHQYHTLHKQPVVTVLTARPGEQHEFPFELTLPWGTPQTLVGSSVWLETTAAIAGAVDPGDTDDLEVLPTPDMDTVIQAVKSLGFRFRGTENSFHAGKVIQELSFLPPAAYYKQMHEIELAFVCTRDLLEVRLEVDRAAKGFLGVEVERRGRWMVSRELLDQGRKAVAAEFEERLRLLS